MHKKMYLLIYRCLFHNVSLWKKVFLGPIVSIVKVVEIWLINNVKMCALDKRLKAVNSMCPYSVGSP